MPVIIRDFSVETNDQSQPAPTGGTDASPAPARPLSGRQLDRLLKAARQRACRLHAD